MRIPSRQREFGLRFNITPLIDVVFLLIIFFLAASHFVRNEMQEEVELPTATQEEDPSADDSSPSRLVLTITRDEQLHVAGRAVSLVEVEHLIQQGSLEHQGDFELRIRGDRHIPYRLIEPLLTTAAAAGVTKIKFAVIAE